MAECLSTGGTLVCLLLRCGWHIVGVVVEIDVPLEELLLAEGLITIHTLVRLLIRVDQHVRLKMPLTD